MKFLSFAFCKLRCALFFRRSRQVSPLKEETFRSRREQYMQERFYSGGAF